MVATAKPVVGGDEWVLVDFSSLDARLEERARADARAARIYSRVLNPVAFALCANASSMSGAVLGIAGWTLLKPAVMQVLKKGGGGG